MAPRKSSPAEVRVRLKDGRVRYFELSAAPWKDGTRTFITAILRDVDDRRAAEAALRESERQSRANEKAMAELNEALEETTGQLRAMDQRKNEFLATLAHELRNPLAPLRNGLQLLKIAKGDSALIERTRAHDGSAARADGPAHRRSDRRRPHQQRPDGAQQGS